MSKRTLTIDIVGNNSSAKRALSDTETAAGKAGDGIVAKIKGKLGGLSGIGSAALGGIFGGGTFAAISSLQPAIAGVVDEYQESVKVGRETERVIRTTGGAANVTAGQVGKLAEKLSEKVGVDDEVIQRSENLLLTFKNVRNEAGKGNDVFTRSVKLSEDMATSMGVDQNKAAIQLGKALNDPIKGLTSLRRVGVSFNQQQQDQIKTMVASGDTLGAQKLILAELQSEFGGAAAAAATPLDKLKVKLKNFQESIGRFAVEDAMPWLQGVWPKVEKEFSDGFAKVMQIVRPGVEIVQILWHQFGGDIVGFITGVWNSVQMVVQGAFNIVKGIFDVALAVLRGDWGAAWDGIKEIVTGVWQIIVGAIEGAWTIITTIVSISLETIGAVMSAAWSGVVSLVTGAWEGIKGIVSDGISTIVGFIAGAPGAIAGLFWGFLNAGAQLGGAVIGGISNGLSSAADAIAGVATGVFNAFKSGWNSVARTINDFIPDKIGFDTPFGFFGVDLPNNPLPTFHTGGVVPGRPGEDVLAVLQAGERVIPRNQVRSTSSTAGPSMIVIPVQFDGRVLTEITVHHLNKPGGPRISQRAIANR